MVRIHSRTLISDSVSTWGRQSSVTLSSPAGRAAAGTGTPQLLSLSLWAKPALAAELATGGENEDRRENAPNGQLDAKNTTQADGQVPEAESQVCNGEACPRPNPAGRPSHLSSDQQWGPGVESNRQQSLKGLPSGILREGRG